MEGPARRSDDPSPRIEARCPVAAVAVVAALRQKSAPVGGPTGVLCAGTDFGSDERIEGVDERGEVEVGRCQPGDARDPDRIDARRAAGRRTEIDHGIRAD